MTLEAQEQVYLLVLITCRFARYSSSFLLLFIFEQ